jgi:predicted anti-sigma-YlaC factor YlaD
MSCLRPDRMDLFLEGELDGPERCDVEGHLAACPACRRVLEERRVLSLAVAGLPAIEVPSDFARAVMDRLPTERRPAFGWLASAATGTALFLAGLLGYHLLTGESLAGVLVSVGRSVIGFVSLVIPILAKVFKLVRVFIKVVADLGTALLKGLGVLASLLRPEILGLVLALGLVLFFLVFFGVRKIVSLGEKP